ncbi:hypothetical protein H6G41_01545 [Tolypothrix sp. FACHB-123]|uniref:hypothetical protein n=1 Tax=Tolypothrix sp. FACHB-123 TaxID=2692868 RepID=UPI0016857717|nr:hypothetical protein [Tolypothrix sp. FACHB-123]MBD2353315.1 hypothetical protein [Tolypothrix sp. FACHB-123]
MLDIKDLSYLENISATELIVGGAVLAITPVAFAEGDDTYTSANTNINIKNKGKVTKAKGTGTALAIGTKSLADVYVSYEGWDKVKVKTRSKTGKNSDYETVKVIALDLPN